MKSRHGTTEYNFKCTMLENQQIMNAMDNISITLQIDERMLGMMGDRLYLNLK